MDLLKIKAIVQAEMSDKRSAPYNERGDKYFHGERVAILALRLRNLLFPYDSGSDDILTVAAWFHDIRNGQDNHQILGSSFTRELLSEHCTAAELDEICGVIAVHDTRNPRENSYTDTIKLHQDADHLDHFGTLGIWRSVASAIGHDESINDAVYFQNNRSGETIRWRRELNYDLSKRIFDDKEAFVQTFIDRFAIEAFGGIWNEKEILKRAE